MEEQKPTIGRIVTYNTTEKEQTAMRDAKDNVQEKLPAIIVAEWGETCVNLKVIADGKNDLWVTSSNKGDQPGQWSWPERK